MQYCSTVSPAISFRTWYFATRTGSADFLRVYDKNIGNVDRSFYLPYNLNAIKQSDYKEEHMEEILESLEHKRKSLYKKLEKMGDFRRGLISVNYRRCGKKNCICAKEGHPGHGPQYLWNATIKRKSHAKNLKLGTELQKYTKETDNYRSFIKLCNEIVQVNERICDLRPVPEIDDTNELKELKKKLQRQFMKKYRKRVTE